MSSERDDLFGKLCVQQGYLTPDALAEARASQATAEEQLGMAMSLADVAVSKKLLTSQQREEVMRLLRVQTGEARTVGGYEVVAKIGEGGMGVVYKARTQGGETVALKVLPPSLARTPGLLKRFQREAEVARSLAHDSIVRFIEFGLDRDKKLYYCALEFVEGEDLARKVSREGKVAEKDALEIARRIALALEHASARGLVHRDVKPQNVMLTPSGTAKLLDLGLARSVGEGDTRMTQEGMFVGSPHYASPEQARGERELDVRSDIYSLGATLYYMVTGETPFPAPTAAAVLTQVVSGSLPWPAEVNADVSEGTCLLIEKMMARDPADRYARPAELARDIDILIAGGEAPVEPVERGMSAVERPGRGGRGPVGARQRRSTRGHAPLEREGSGGGTATYVALGAGLAVVALVVLFLVYGRKETERPAPVAQAPRRVAPAKKKKPTPPGADRERQLEDMLAFAEKYHKDNPAEFERAVTNFQKARDAARGTRLQLVADSRAQEIREEWKRAALEALSSGRSRRSSRPGSRARREWRPRRSRRTGTGFWGRPWRPRSSASPPATPRGRARRSTGPTASASPRAGRSSPRCSVPCGRRSRRRRRRGSSRRS
ncbi:MAG: serine/threonine-protein kinase, partial [Planctomycetota bacterium]